MKLITNMKIIFYNFIFTYKVHIKWLPKLNMILENLIMPILSGLFFVVTADYISNENLIFYISGSICFTAVDACIGGVSMLISSERRFGTLYATVGSVFPPIYLFLGRMAYWCVIGYVRFLAVFFTLFLLFIPERLTFLLWIQCSIIYFMISISLSGIGYLVGIIGIKKRSIMGLCGAITSLILLFSQVYFSKELICPVIRNLCYLSPLYYGVIVCRDVIIYGKYDGILFNMLAMFAIGGAYMVAGNIYFHCILKKILIEDQLDIY